MKNLFLVMMAIHLVNCSQMNSTIPHSGITNRAPSEYDEVITSKKLSTMRPVQILNRLKNDPQTIFMVEPTFISFWGESEILELMNYLNDHSVAAPVVSTISSISCRGHEFLSTVAREAQHLINAIKEKKYPQALCSTYDFHP
ncbi:MAG: hypothetical protein KBD76_15290 [Bacteriovorax sp.]|nr:hypothetical protein [Bacteriovorax sp.]